MLLLLVLAAARAAAIGPQDGALELSLYTNDVPSDSGNQVLSLITDSLGQIASKYGVTTRTITAHELSSTTTEGGGTNVQLQNEQESSGGYISYYANITIGTRNPQTFSVTPDTGSADLVVPASDCSATSDCAPGSDYNNEGTSLQNTTKILYLGGTESGTNYIDNIEIAGLSTSSQGLVAVPKADKIGHAVMGLGFKALAASGFTPIFENLMASNSSLYPQFSFFLGRGTSHNSSLILGGNDTSKYSDVNTVRVTKEGYWQIAVDGMSVNGISIGSSVQSQASVDTGNTLSYLPIKIASAVFQAIPNSVPFNITGQEGMTFYAYPCNTTQSYIPSFILNDRTMPFNITDFNAGTVTSGNASALGGSQLTDQVANLDQKGVTLCIASVVGSSNSFGSSGLDYVLGDSFLKNYYTIFNYPHSRRGPSVAFGQLV